MRITPACILLVSILLAAEKTYADTPTTCTYQTYTWNTKLKRAVDRKTVRKPYADLAPIEIDRASGCTVCREDQVNIALPNIREFKMCRKYATKVEQALLNFIKQGIPIRTVTSYRVGKTRGDADGNGLRTRFSNHSFGIALDINAGQNGLYDRCIRFGPHCRLIRGGFWRPGQVGSWRRFGPVVRTLRHQGFRWGGAIAGKQKDFMHFSPTGY